MFSQVEIEYWRYRTNINTLTTLEDAKDMEQGYFKMNHTFIDILKNSYITTRDLTNLKLEDKQTRPLKAKNVLKKLMSGMVKTFLTPPKFTPSSENKDAR